MKDKNHVMRVKSIFSRMLFDCLYDVFMFVLDRKEEFFKFQEKLDSEMFDMEESEDSEC